MEFVKRYKSFVLPLVATVLMVLAPDRMLATHLRAGDISVRHISGRTYEITLTVFTKETEVRFSHNDTGLLDFGDGTSINLKQQTGQLRTDLDPDGTIRSIKVVVQHTFPGNGSFTISYQEANRNQGVLNMDNSVNTPFYIETQINVQPVYGSDNSPVLSVPPIDKGCSGQTWFHNPGAYDPDPGDSLSYELVVPYMATRTEVVNYSDPNKQPGSKTEGGATPAIFKIDTKGLITWDAPKTVGEYNIAFLVIEWRKIKGVWTKWGFVRRDMQIIIEGDCENHRPVLSDLNDKCVVAGTKVHQTIIGTDPDNPATSNGKVRVDAFSPLLDKTITIPVATFIPLDSPNVFRTPPDVHNFDWQTSCAHVRERPYDVTFKVTDAGTLRLTAFKSWSIKVVGPPPTWDDAVLTPATRSVKLTWDKYKCETEAEAMQVWRHIDPTQYALDTCVTGMPDLGYTLVATVPLGDASNPITSYTDTGLAPGAYYCYRLVAVYPLEKTGGALSLVSRDTCVGPFDLDAPVITKVSVAVTSSDKGKINLEWVTTAPTAAVSYKIYRGVGLEGAVDPTPIATTANKFYNDSLLNTVDNPYHYRIDGYDGTGALVGYSADASSVRLETESRASKIVLHWTATVPWTNSVANLTHDIYRGPQNATEADLVFLTSVTPTGSDYEFTDNGPFTADQEYCYRVMTRGTYGKNPLSTVPITLPFPLENYSEIICAAPGDTIPPCPPPRPMRVDSLRCDVYVTQNNCSAAIFPNQLTWTRPQTPECRKDTYIYHLYQGSSPDDVTFLLWSGTDTTYTDNRSDGFKSCYLLVAEDRSGNVSQASEVFCVDNCPNYELPNIFTPGSIDSSYVKTNPDGSESTINFDCNKVFRAFGGNDTGEISPCHFFQREKCPRFVKSVDFHVYNRWGREVFNYYGTEMKDDYDPSGNSSGGESGSSVYINWDGNDSNGKALPQGVYFYIAKVTFDVFDPSKQTKIIKGTVQLLR